MEAMTVSDLDIYRSADLLVRRHGAEAPIEAAMHADSMRDGGDLDGQAGGGGEIGIVFSAHAGAVLRQAGSTAGRADGDHPVASMRKGWKIRSRCG